MNKKNILKVLTITAATMAALSSCNQSAPKVDAKSDTPQKVPASLKIAYVEVDSIMSQYKFCKDYSLILQRKGQNIKSTLAAKQQQLQAAAAYTREQAEAINANLQKQNADLQMLDQRLTNEFQNETEKYNNALRDSIQHYLKIYNQDKHYSLILSKAGDNLLYADKAFDITNEVVAGLNKAYKPSAKMTAAAAKK